MAETSHTDRTGCGSGSPQEIPNQEKEETKADEGSILLAKLVEDLLRDVPESHRPVLQKVASYAARSLIWIENLYRTLDVYVCSSRYNLKGFKELLAIKEHEERALHRHLLTLQLLLDRACPAVGKIVPLQKRTSVPPEGSGNED